MDFERSTAPKLGGAGAVDAGSSLEERWLAEHMRGTAAHIVASVAHALGSPLNVISGRAEMIRRDPSNALVQLERIEQQVQKIAGGLRDMVDFLGLAEPPRESVALGDVWAELAALIRPHAERRGQAVIFDPVPDAAVVDRHHVVGTLLPLLLLAVRSAAARPQGATLRPRVSAVVQTQWVVIELIVPGLAPVQGFQLEQFHARPSGASVEAYQMLSVASANARGGGGKLQLEALPDSAPVQSGAEAASSVLRFSCRREDVGTDD